MISRYDQTITSNTGLKLFSSSNHGFTQIQSCFLTSSYCLARPRIEVQGPGNTEGQNWWASWTSCSNQLVKTFWLPRQANVTFYDPISDAPSLIITPLVMSLLIPFSSLPVKSVTKMITGYKKSCQHKDNMWLRHSSISSYPQNLTQSQAWLYNINN